MNSLLNEELFHKVLMTSNQVKKALIRISHEIYEKNDDFDNLILLGILTRGVHISNRIVEILNQLYSVNIKSSILDPKYYRDDVSYTNKETSKFSKISRKKKQKNNPLSLP